MLKSLLIGLDGSDDARAALDLGLRWAARFNARAVGLSVVDEPGIYGSAEVLLSGSHHWHSDAATPLLSKSHLHSKKLIGEFAARCEAAHVTGTALDESGTPFVRILEEAQSCDLVVLGQRTHFDFGMGDEPDETLGKVIRDSPRPVVAVPCGHAPQGGAVVIAYDGSLQASRALYAFVASGLGGVGKVHVVSLDDDREDAAEHAGRAQEYLGNHGIDACTNVLRKTRSPSDSILGLAQREEAGLLVMGAYGQPVLREFFLGSTTRAVLGASPVPVFCYH